jgi:hypothetical protein
MHICPAISARLRFEHACVQLGRIMIRVRYKDLSSGLHGMAERSGRGTTVYLLPGLTGGQRSAALRRLRQEASRGCGPQLRGPDLAVALAADRFRVGVRNTAAVVRQHPAGSLLPTALAATLMALFVFASVSARIALLQQSAPPGALMSSQGAPTMASPPAFAHGKGMYGHGPAAHRAAAGYASGGEGTPSWTPVPRTGSPKHATPPGTSSGAHATCRQVGGGAGNLAGGQNLTRQEAWACGPAPSS